MSELVYRFELVTGRAMGRGGIWRWLSNNPDVKVEPSFGNGLVLCRLIRDMRREYITMIAPPGATGPLGDVLYPKLEPPVDRQK